MLPGGQEGYLHQPIGLALINQRYRKALQEGRGGTRFLWAYGKYSPSSLPASLHLLTICCLGLAKAVPNLRSIKFDYRITSVGPRHWNLQKVTSLYSLNGSFF